MKLTVTVRANGRFCDAQASIVVPEPLEQCFEPMKVAVDPFLAGALDEKTCAEAEIKIKLREDAANYIAKALTDLLTQEMRKYDTLNGYYQDGRLLRPWQESE